MLYEVITISVINAGLTTLIVPIVSLEAIIKIKPDMEELKRFCVKSQIDIIKVYTAETRNKTNDYRTRVFAPTFGYLVITSYSIHYTKLYDASQGVQAQTISNLYMAIEHDLEIIPIINKCDMASAMPEEVEDEIVELLGCKREEIIRASGKTGMGIEEILAAVIERIPCPVGDEEAPLQALIFDSVFNSFRGIIAYSYNFV